MPPRSRRRHRADTKEDALPFSYSIDHLRRLVRVSASGVIRPAERVKNVDAVMELLAASPGYAVVADYRRLRRLPNLRCNEELMAHVGRRAELLRGGVAVVVAPGVGYGLARYQEVVASLYGVTLLAFTEPEAAAVWAEARARASLSLAGAVDLRSHRGEPDPGHGHEPPPASA